MSTDPVVVNRLAKFDDKLRELKSIHKDFPSEDYTKEAKKSLDDVVQEIDRRRRAFDSKTFFMVTFGMLKAGKSTLVNTFVGKQVSPVGSAHETTLRSSIILAADNDNKVGIYIYSPKEGADVKIVFPDEPLSEEEKKERDQIIRNKKVNDCRMMMDFLNGIMTKSEFLESFKESFEDLSDETKRKHCGYIFFKHTRKRFRNSA